MAVNELCDGVPFHFEAPAGFCIPTGERRSFDNDLGSAITDAKMLTASASTRASFGRMTFYGKNFNCNKSSKSKADEGYLFRHIIASFNGLFSGGRPADTGARCVIFSNRLEVCK